MSEDACLLNVRSLTTGYGKKQVLNGVSLQLGSGEIAAIVGHNGAGKSTLLKAIFGLLPIWQGAIRLNGTVTSQPNPREMLRAGVVLVPQGNRVFTDLTVRENLELGGTTIKDKSKFNAGIARTLAVFEALKPRLDQRAGTLSGGEKQILALANALVLSPRLLLLDEPSLGLAPPVVSVALRRIEQINRDSGVAVLIVEQKVREVMKIVQRVHVLRNGQVSFSGSVETLNDVKLREAFL